MEADEPTAKRQKKVSVAGTGCLVQALAVFVFLGSAVFGPLGLIAGGGLALLLFLWGSRLAVRSVCSRCGNRLPEKDARLCPTCLARLA